MPLKTGWLKYLWRERRSVLLRQIIRMAKLYKTPFKNLLRNILEVVEENNAGFTLPIVASIALRRPEIASLILSFHQEIASHGNNHVNYRYLSSEAQRTDITGSLQAFKELGVHVRGFRAPYNMYADETPRLLEEFDFLWDGGLGFRPPYSDYTRFFRVPVNGRRSSYVCIPLCRWSDDRMIDNYGLDNKQMTRLLKARMKRAQKNHGVVMFDLHPIRIGQPKYIGVLKRVLADGKALNGWFPTVTEAVEYWLRHHEWKDGASFCCLLTGDIDNCTFFEYLTRLF
ncbi:hypothetical protein CW712_05840 [Candidatus Bathyarchaeota archaeon]|nr:MAG: hypothetical protein CW712_05840 [Candidatus Bathyarchaeota archaeon]